MTSFPPGTTAEPTDNGAVERDVAPTTPKATELPGAPLVPPDPLDLDLDTPEPLGAGEGPEGLKDLERFGDPAGVETTEVVAAPEVTESAEPEVAKVDSVVEPQAFAEREATDGELEPVAEREPVGLGAEGLEFTEPEAEAPRVAQPVAEPIAEPVAEPVTVIEPLPLAETPAPARAPEVVVIPTTAVATVEAAPEGPILPTAPLTPQPVRRLASLDALRGFDMLWIIGLDGIAEGLGELAKGGRLGPLAKPLAFVQNQLTHRPWEGLAFEDLIFPLFIFIVGVSVVFSLTRAMAEKPRGRVVLRILVRSALLYLFGLMVYHGFDQPIHAFAGQTGRAHAVRWLGVLQRIAICYCAAALLFCFVRARYIALITVLLLVGYWLLMSYVNVPGVGRGSYLEGQNLANYLDQHYLGGYKWDGDHDPEGYLSTLPAIATCLLGIFAGLLLRGERPRPAAKFAALLLGGAALAALGYAWGFRPSPVHMPVIKKLWTSSYVLLAAGYSAMMLALFYLVIDVWRLRGWAAPFVWVGSNAITLYMVAELGGFVTVATRLVGGGRYNWPLWGAGQRLVTSLVALALVLVLARFLYRRGVYVRV